MQRLFLLCLFATACAVTDVGVPDTDVSNYLLKRGSAGAAAESAARWLFERRGEWGPFLPRAVVALSVAEGAGALSLPGVEWDLLAEQVSVLVSIEMYRDESRERPLSASRLSHLVHALLATCREPRRFHGRDLVKKLRSEADRLTEDATPPLLYVTLCLTGAATHKDLTRLSRVYQRSYNRTDVQALQLLAMSCITALPFFSSGRPIFQAYVRQFTGKFHATLRRNTTNVYTKAMAMQALNSAGVSSDVSSLLSDQLHDGSFEGSLLATYQAIPALLDASLLALGDATRCKTHATANKDGLESSFGAHGVVHLSLWIGEEGGDRDTHTVTVPNGANYTVLDVLTVARAKNDIFRFSYDVTPSGGVRVYSLAGIPNDIEKQRSWLLHVQKSGPNERLHDIRNKGVDKVYPSAGDHVAFWYKKDGAMNSL